MVVVKDFALVIKLVVAGFLVFLCSLLVSTFSVFRPLEYQVLERWQASNTRQILSRRGTAIPASSVDSMITVVDLWVADKSNQEYLDFCQRIADEISRFQPAAFMIPLPRGLLLTDRSIRSLQHLNDLPFVIFGQPLDRMPLGQRFTRHPALGRFRLRWGVITLQSPGSWWSHNWIYPLGYIDPVDKMWIPDVSLRIVQLYRGETEAEPVQSIDGIHLGSIHIPLFSREAAFVMTSQDPFRFTIISAMSENDSDTLTFGSSSNSYVYYQNVLPDSLERYFRGRMVILARSTPSNYDERFVYYAYINVISGIVSGSFVVDGSEYTMLMFLVIIAIAVLSVYYLRPSAAVGLIVASGIAVEMFSIWILATQHVYLDTVYNLFAAVLCLIVMPVLRLSHENKRLKESLSSVGRERES